MFYRSGMSYEYISVRIWCNRGCRGLQYHCYWTVIIIKYGLLRTVVGLICTVQHLGVWVAAYRSWVDLYRTCTARTMVWITLWDMIYLLLIKMVYEWRPVKIYQYPLVHARLHFFSLLLNVRDCVCTVNNIFIIVVSKKDTHYVVRLLARGGGDGGKLQCCCGFMREPTSLYRTVSSFLDCDKSDNTQLYLIYAI